MFRALNHGDCPFRASGDDAPPSSSWHRLRKPAFLHCARKPTDANICCAAMFCGAVLVKPTMQHVASWPEDLFVPGETFIECGMLFEDAVEIVERVGRDWPAYRKMREPARARAMHARDRVAVLARLKQIIEEVL